MAQSQNQRLRRMAEKAARRKAVVAQKRRAEAAAAAVSESLQILDAERLYQQARLGFVRAQSQRAPHGHDRTLGQAPPPEEGQIP